MKIKIIKVHDNGAVDLQIGKDIFYGCYPISVDEQGDTKISVDFEIKGIPVGHRGFDPLGNIHFAEE